MTGRATWSADRRSTAGRPVRDGGRAGTPRVGGDRSLPQPYRRRRRLAAVLIGVLVLAGLGVTGCMLLYEAGLADVADVAVTGAVSVPVRDVLAAAAVPPGGPLAAVDTAGIAARVARLPGVARVEVSRDWPHTVAVAITERVPVAVAPTPQGTFLVDGTGVPYLPAPAAAELPRLTFGAVGPDDPSTRAALVVLAALPEPVRAEVRTVDITAGTVTLGLTEDRTVRWGSPDRAAEKAVVLGPLLTQSGQVYDVASPELPTVRR